jgi:serine/threonine-protein kinase
LNPPPGVIPLTQAVEPPPLVRFDKYLLVRKLAEGGMAEIYLAKQVGAEGFERDVVIKLMLGHLSRSREFVEMFLDEARLAAKLHHPNIVQISDLGFADQRYFICMEYLPGEDLQSIVEALVERRQAIPLGLACKIILSACEGLEFAHAYAEGGRPVGLVHRDVSPSNIIVTYQGTVKVLDFGIAKASSKLTQTQPGLLKGKLGYMSPEQARGDPLDARSDLFSLGVTLHELITGQRVFQKESEMGVLLALMQQPIPPPSALRPDVPPALDRIAMRALEKDPDRRYPDAAAMRVDLEAFLASTSSIPGMTQLAQFMQSLFGREQAQRKMQIPSLRELTGGADLSGLGTSVDRQGTDPTYVRPLATPHPGAPGELGPEPPTRQERPQARHARAEAVTEQVSAPPPPAAVEPARPAPATGRRGPGMLLGALLALLALGAAGGGGYWALVLRSPVTQPPPPSPPPLPVVEPPPPPPVEAVQPPPVEPPPPPVAPPPEPPPERPITLTTKEVGATLARVRSDVRVCFDRHRPSLPDAAGKVEVELAIANSGAVRTARVVTAGYEAGPLAKCLTRTLKAVRFPRNNNRPPMTIIVPYSYSAR